MSVQTIQLDTHGVVMDIVVSDEGTVFMSGLHAAGDVAPVPASRMQPLVEVMAIGHGHMLSNTRFTHTAIGRRLQYAGHGFRDDHGFTTLSITMVDQVTALTATAIFRGKRGVAALQTWVELANNGDSEVILQTVSSLSSGAFLDAGEDTPRQAYSALAPNGAPKAGGMRFRCTDAMGCRTSTPTSMIMMPGAPW
jgi:alpha-galactosidase